MSTRVAEAPRSIACSSCGAPAALSLAASELRCPHCARIIVLPPGTERELARARAVFAELDTFARNLEAARTRIAGLEASTLLFVVTLLLLSCGGFFALGSVWNLIDKGFHAERQLPLLGALVVTAAVACVALGIHRFARRRLERAYAAIPPDPSAPAGACHLCGAALPPLGSARGITRCTYCATDNLLGSKRTRSRAEHERRTLTEHAAEMRSAIRFVRVATMSIGFLVMVVMPLCGVGTLSLLSVMFSR